MNIVSAGLGIGDEGRKKGRAVAEDGTRGRRYMGKVEAEKVEEGLVLKLEEEKGAGR